jgi:hypothetical protein
VGSSQASATRRGRELASQATTDAIVANPTFPATTLQLKDLEKAVRAIGVQLHILHASTDEDIDLAFASIAQPHRPRVMRSCPRGLHYKSLSSVECA